MKKNYNFEKKYFIAIAGPTGSGKTFLAKQLVRRLGSRNCIAVSQDQYYKDLSFLSKKERKINNFDDIKSFDLSLFKKHIRALKKGQFILQPRYSFTSSRRLKRQKKILPKRWIIIEGLMPFATRELLSLFDLTVYIDAHNYICLARRIKRDVKERGESLESVCKRYLQDVLPMQFKYVEKQKSMADIIVDGNLPVNEILNRVYNSIVK